MADQTYQIFALRYGRQPNRVRSGSFVFDGDHKTPHPLDYYVWLIRNEHRTVLVDTGFSHQTAKDTNQSLDFEPIELIKRLGIRPDDISDLVISHLHFDHAGTLPEFERSQFHLQESEMAFATGPCICHPEGRIVYHADHVCQAVRQAYLGKLTYHSGDAWLAPGIRLLHLPGHTDGIQGVEVATKRGAIILASDASHFYENYRKGRIFPLVANSAEMLGSHARLRSLASDTHIIPGHDPLVGKAFPNHFDGDDTIVRLDLEPDMAVLEAGWSAEPAT